jgi:glucan phosphoethanolaminetransferase (alkaline phosphatase superfamily)
MHHDQLKLFLSWAIRVFLILLMIALILITIPYYIYLSQLNDTVSIIVFAICACFIIFVAIAGVVVAVLGTKNLIAVFATAMAGMTLLGIAQLVLVIVSISDCNTSTDQSIIQLFCNPNVANTLYYFQACATIVITLLGAVLGLAWWFFITKKWVPQGIRGWCKAREGDDSSDDERCTGAYF